MNTPKRKPTQERKSEIVDAALDLSMDVGPGRLTTEALAKKVGVSHGAIFRHFPSKAAIWSAVFETIAKKMEQTLGGLTPSASPSKRLGMLVRGQLTLVTAIPALPSIIFSRELHKGNAGIQNGVLALMKRFHAVLADTIQAGIDCGELKPTLDADGAASMIIAILQGTVLRWTLARGKFDLVGEGDKMVALALAGLQKNA